MHFFRRHQYSLVRAHDEKDSTYNISRNKILAYLVIVPIGCFVIGAVAFEALKGAISALQQPPSTLPCKTKQRAIFVQCEANQRGQYAQCLIPLPTTEVSQKPLQPRRIVPGVTCFQLKGGFS